MFKKILIIVISIIALGALFSYKLYEDKLASEKMANFQPPPVKVTATTATAKQWSKSISSIGSLEAKQGINVTPQVPGTVATIDFQSGQTVQKGQALLSLDTSVLQAQIENATAAMNMKNATFKRNTMLFKTNAVSDSAVDLSRSEYNQAVATVKQLKATLAQMTIYAPFAGKLGLRDVNLGQYLTAGQVITNLQSIDPILVNFSIDSQDINKVKPGMPIQIKVDSYQDKTFTGQVIAVNAQLSVDTRSLIVRGQIPNSDGLLVPGMFVQVSVIMPTSQQTIVVPQNAITYTLYGNSVFVITKKTDAQGKVSMTVKQQTVTVGDRKGSDIAIVKGLQANQMIVTSGQLKLQNGSSVTLVDDSK